MVEPVIIVGRIIVKFSRGSRNLVFKGREGGRGEEREWGKEGGRDSL